MNLLIVIIAASMSACDCLRILAVLPFPMKSHQIMFNSLLLALVERGHHVTVYSNTPIRTNSSNYRHIPIQSSLALEYVYSFENLKTKIDKEVVLKPLNIQMLYSNLSEETLNLPQIKSLTQSEEQFDVVLLETFFGQEALIGFGHKFSAPVVTLSSFGSNSLIDSLTGNPNPLAYFSSYQLPFSSNLTLYQKIKNVIKTLTELYYSYYHHLPKQQVVLEKHFTNCTKLPLPSLMDLLGEVALVLLNTQPEVSYPRPWLPNIILVGGLHIPQMQTALPKDIQQFIDGAEDGFIYFSLGTTFSIASMPNFIKEAFITAFGNVSQRVIWKIDTPPAGLPENVMVVNWAPQVGILANPRCRAFISHGGLLSLLEATHFAVPLVGIPVFADQPWNIAKVKQAEIGVSLRLMNISADSVTWALNEVLFNSKYRRNMQRLSAQMRDRLTESPLDTAVHWVEYVAKHKGAPQLRSPARHMSSFHYLLIDVILLILLTSTITVMMLYILCKAQIVLLGLKLYTKIKIKRH